jgi:hypothetical protein
MCAVPRPVRTKYYCLLIKAGVQGPRDSLLQSSLDWSGSGVCLSSGLHPVDSHDQDPETFQNCIRTPRCPHIHEPLVIHDELATVPE